MDIIKSQRDILENLYSYVSQLNSTPPQAHILSAFIHKIGYTEFEAETGNLLLEELKRLMLSMKTILYLLTEQSLKTELFYSYA